MQLNFEHTTMEELKNIILDDNESFDIIYYNHEDTLYIYLLSNSTIIFLYPIKNYTDDEKIEIEQFINNLEFNDVSFERRDKALEEFYARINENK